MKLEYEQKFSTGMPGSPIAKVVETSQGQKQYFYGKDAIDEQRFQKLFTNMQHNGSLVESKKIIVLDDADKQVSQVAWSDNEVRTSLEASVMNDNKNFKYEQIQQKTSKLSIRGKLATAYINIQYGDQKSEYIDQQPSLDDPLLDTRDEILNPYMQVFSGRSSFVEFAKQNGAVATESNQNNDISKLPIDQINNALFDYIMNGIKDGSIHPEICAKSVAVDARQVKPEEVGQKHTVYSHGKVEKEITLAEDTVLLTTLDTQGKPVIDQNGNTNTYDMKLAKFMKTYPKQVKGGHFVKDPYAPGSVMVAVKIPENVIADGITMLPPGWGGYEGTLMAGGIMMFPFDPSLKLNDQVKAWETQGADKLDWYPNNEANTYSRCDKNGTFENENLRNLFEQDKPFEKTPYQYQDKTINGTEMGM